MKSAKFYKLFFLGESKSKRYYYSKPLSAVVSVSKSKNHQVKKLKDRKIGCKRVQVHSETHTVMYDSKEFSINLGG